MYKLFLLLAASSLAFLLVNGSSTAQKHVLVQVPSSGALQIFGKDVHGRAVKVVNSKHQESLGAAVVMATDGHHVLVKSEYDHQGHLIECELVKNPSDIDQFTHHVEESIQHALMNKNHNQLINHKPVHHGDVFDVNAQVKACEEFKPPQSDEQDQDEVDHGRSKRSYLIWPGTNWCGKGSKAEFAESYGPNKAADQCCQKHDQCPYVIAGLTTKFNLFNYRIHTLSHCDCDEKFLTCLKSANTSTANMVGKVYFNVVNTECFDLSLQKSCAKRSWWGGCEKYTTKWTATIKTLGNFPEVPME